VSTAEEDTLIYTLARIAAETSLEFMAENGGATDKVPMLAAMALAGAAGYLAGACVMHDEHVGIAIEELQRAIASVAIKVRKARDEVKG